MERKKKILKFSALAFALVLCCCMILPAATPANAYVPSGTWYADYVNPYDFSMSYYLSSDSYAASAAHSFPRIWADVPEVVNFSDPAGVCSISGYVTPNLDGLTDCLQTTVSFPTTVYNCTFFQTTPLFCTNETGLPSLSVGSLNESVSVRFIVQGWYIVPHSGQQLETFSKILDATVEAGELLCVSDLFNSQRLTYDFVVTQISLMVYSTSDESRYYMDDLWLQVDAFSQVDIADYRNHIDELLTYVELPSGDLGTDDPVPTVPHVCPTIPGETVYIGVGELGPGIEAIGNSLFDIRITEHFVVGDFVVIIIGVCIFALVLKLFAGGK